MPSKPIWQSPQYIALAAFAALCILALFVFSPSHAAAMTVFHIVSFKTNSASSLPALSEAMLALKHECKRDGKPYILSLQGGKQTSTEGHEGGMQIVFVAEFKDQDDCDYYLWKDPAHDHFKKNALGDLNGVTVLDFTAGQF